MINVLGVSIALILIAFAILDMYSNRVAPDECVPIRCSNCGQLLDARESESGIEIWYMLKYKVDCCPRCGSQINIDDFNPRTP